MSLQRSSRCNRSNRSNRSNNFQYLRILFFSIFVTYFVSTQIQHPSNHASTVLLVSAKRIDRNVPHGHKGILSTYKPGPFDTKLDSDDKKNLAKGNPVMKQLPADDGDELAGKAICIQDVAAPKRAVWNQILDLNSYKGKVNSLKECKNYMVKTNHKEGTVTIKTKMVIGVMPGYSYENYYDHSFSPKDDSITWSLDYDKTSDFDDVAGHWHVEDHPEKANECRVFYACDVKFKASLPTPIRNFVQKTALKQATGWVKRESEGKPDADIPKEYKLAFGL